MSGGKYFIQSFGKDFEGVDAETSPIETDVTGFNRAQNYELGPQNSLRGRVGTQHVGQTYPNFFGIFTYTYPRTTNQYVARYQTTSGVYPAKTGSIGSVMVAANGETSQELIAINSGMWSWKESSIVVTRVSGTYPFSQYVAFDDVNSVMRYVIKDGAGATILNFNAGTGYEASSAPITYYDILQAINATAEFSINVFDRALCPPCAIINGAQVPAFVSTVVWGRRYRITVDAGHSFVPGDRLMYLYDVTSGGMVGGFVVATGATTIDFVTSSVGVSAVNIPDNAIIGALGTWASSLPIGPANITASGDLSLSFPYWDKVSDIETNLSGGAFGPAMSTWIGGTTNVLPSATSADGCLFVATTASPTSAEAFANKLFYYDTRQLSRAGVSAPSTFTAVAAAGGALAGVYRYKAYVKRIDAQGNIVEGTPTSPISVTLGGGNNQATITAQAFAYSSITGFGVKSCLKYTAEAPAANSLFYVDDNTAAPGVNAYIEVGDPVCFYDNAGTLHRTTVTKYDGTTTPSSICVADQSGYTIADNTPISSGVTVVVLRTTAGGNKYYVLREIVTTGYGTVAYTDNTSDATLQSGIQWVDAPIGKEHDAPPSCSLVCQHQGGLVTARSPTQPNTVSFSTADGIQYFPIASNAFDIPSTVSGPITAIASDTVDRLAVFKSQAYYDVVGDLDGGAFTVNVKNEGDYGISSQASLIRVNNRLVGMSKLGIVVISEGSLDPMMFARPNSKLIGRRYAFHVASAVNHASARQYIVTVPHSLTHGDGATTFVVDYSRLGSKTLERSYDAPSCQPQRGYTVYNDILYYLSDTNCVRENYRFIGNSPTGLDGDTFIDQIAPITYVLESPCYTLGDPSQLKTPQRLRVWSIPSEEVVSGWVPFRLNIETAAGPLSTYLGSPNNGATDTTVSFVANDWFKDVRLVPSKTNFYIVRYTTSWWRESPYISGFEIMFAVNYDKQDLQR